MKPEAPAKHTRKQPGKQPAPSRSAWSAGPRIVYLPARTGPLSRDDIREVFAALGTDAPLTRALRQIVQERTAAAMSDVAGVKVSAEDRAHAGGRLEELLGLMAELIDLTGAQPPKSA